ncbi:MAG: UDP-N-acetylmuramoyl-tripeptide--D-alanyl-D-alanine ligase [Candidatus Saccharimonadales bacterium]
MTPKKLGKTLLCRVLERQVRQLRQNNTFQVVAIAGSVGKTSTKLAIAKTLGSSARVVYQDGNYNDRLTVPLVLFGHTEPGIFNIFAWLKILLKNRQTLKQPYPYDIAVLELGTDGPGQLRHFAYLQPDITVITAIADEHMQYFKTLDAVATEELVPLSFSKKVLLNIEDIADEYLPESDYLSYALHKAADYKITKRQADVLQGQQLTFDLPAAKQLTTEVSVLGEQGAKIALAAVAVADMLGVVVEAIQKGLQTITPVAGRMQVLAGKQDAIIIDDTYNASPVAVKAALDVLGSARAKRRIAILGSMNELGADSPKLHQEVGAYCDPAKLDLVVTIGKQANSHLASAAEKQGCVVKTCDSPYEAGEYVAQQITDGTIILAKGSQNGVFAEEAVKVLLKNPDDASKLVRQSRYWEAVKQRQFPDT